VGIVVEPGVLDDVQRWLGWWYRDSRPRVCRRLHPVLEPRSGSFYDYTVLPWFVVPRETRTGVRER
jgi:hypothetical protein